MKKFIIVSLFMLSGVLVAGKGQRSYQAALIARLLNNWENTSPKYKARSFDLGSKNPARNLYFSVGPVNRDKHPKK